MENGKKALIKGGSGAARVPYQANRKGKRKK